MSAGRRFREALEQEQPLQIPGTINAFSALLAEEAGFKAIYLSGAGVANASFGLPDLAMTTLNDVCEDIRRITYATELPLLVEKAAELDPELARRVHDRPHDSRDDPCRGCRLSY